MDEKEKKILEEYGEWVRLAIMSASSRDIKNLKDYAERKKELREKLIGLGISEFKVIFMVDNLIDILIHFVGYEPFELKLLPCQITD